MIEYVLLAIVVLCLVPLLARMAPLFVHIDWERKDGSHFKFGDRFDEHLEESDGQTPLFSFSWPPKKPEGKKGNEEHE